MAGLLAWAVGRGGQDEDGSDPILLIFTPEQEQYARELDRKASNLSRSIQDLRLRIPPPDISQRLPHLHAHSLASNAALALQLNAHSATREQERGDTHPRLLLQLFRSIPVVCLLLGVVVYIYLRKDKGEWNNTELEEEDEISNTKTLQISYGDINNATQRFAKNNKLGRGGFGTVYKCVLTSGQEIAVKRLERNSTQGESEFRTELLLLAELQHRNLVKLFGYSLAEDERLLVYEFMPNASLDHFLFGLNAGKTKQVSLDWHIRYNIIEELLEAFSTFTKILGFASSIVILKPTAYC